MPIVKREKWCEREICGKYLGIVHPAIKYCGSCRKIIAKETDRKYKQEMFRSTQGGVYGHWGPRYSS